MINRCNDDLRDTADAQAGHEEHSTSSNFGDYAAVDHDGEHADAGENAAVHKWAADICHLLSTLDNSQELRMSIFAYRKEVCSISNHEHGT